MQKSKNFYMLEKKKGCNVNAAGLLFTEEKTVNDWIKTDLSEISS